MSNEFEQPVEPMSRTEDLLRTGTEEPVIAMSEIEKILRGEHIDRPHSRVADLLLKYNPSDILIEKGITENGTYYATADAADGYSSVTVDVQPHVNTRTIKNNGKFISSVDMYDGYDSIIVDVDNGAPNYQQLTVTQNGVYTPPSSSIIIVGLADGIPENTETQVNTGGSVTRKDKLTVKCVNNTTGENVSASIQTELIANKAIPQSYIKKTMIICEDANHYVYITKAGEDLFVTQKGYTFNGQSFELTDNNSAFNMVNVNLPDGTNTEY